MNALERLGRQGTFRHFGALGTEELSVSGSYSNIYITKAKQGILH
jgi:hypothetical protein